MGRTERAPKGTAGLQGVQGGLSPEWSTRGKELMPTERCQTLPCAAARARSGVGKSLLIRRGKTNAPQRPSENHRASQGWGLSTAPPMAAPAYKQGQPPNPGGCSGRALQSCVDPPGPPMQTALSSAGPFPALRVAPHGTWGAAALHLHLYGGPDPLGWGLIAMGTQLRVTPPSRPTQPQRSGAPTQRLAVGRRTPIPNRSAAEGALCAKHPNFSSPNGTGEPTGATGWDAAHGYSRPPPPCLSFPPDPQLSPTTPPPAAPEGAADPTQPPYGWGPPHPWQRALPIQRSLRPNDPKRSTGGGTQTPKLRAAPRSGSGAAVPLPYLLAPQSAASQTLLQPRRAALRAGHQHGAATGTPRGRLRSAHSHNAALRGRFWGRGAFWGRSSFWGRRTRSALS